MENNVEILQKKIKFWTQTMNRSRNDVERATLAGKIREAKEEIKKLTGNNPEKVVKAQMDAPLMIDKVDRENGIMRGKVIDTGAFISVNL